MRHSSSLDAILQSSSVPRPKFPLRVHEYFGLFSKVHLQSASCPSDRDVAFKEKSSHFVAFSSILKIVRSPTASPNLLLDDPRDLKKSWMRQTVQIMSS